MENRFKLLIVDRDSFDRHVGEECGDMHEVLLSPRGRELSEYLLLFRGMIRSIWKDICQDILVEIDTSSECYSVLFQDLLTLMSEAEGISFTISTTNKGE